MVITQEMVEAIQKFEGKISAATGLSVQELRDLRDIMRRRGKSGKDMQDLLQDLAEANGSEIVWTQETPYQTN